MNPDVALEFLDFVVERHKVYLRRQAGAPQPWTDDPTLATRKFTNVFRAIDFGSQFLINELLDPELDERDTLMRCFFYRHTGRVEAWETMELMGGYPTVATLEDAREQMKAYRGATTTIRGKEARNAAGGTKNTFQRPVFTGAYLVFPQSDTPGTDKLDSIVDLTKRLFTPGGKQDIVPDFLAAKTQAERFAVLRRNKGVADFMSMQVLTDWGYSAHCGEDREDEFVVCGPGARKGAAEIVPTAKPEDTVRWALKAVRSLGADTPSLDTGHGVRWPSLMDVQNCLCEFSKYVRGPVAKPYAPAHPGPLPEPVLPAHWSAT